MTTRGLAIGGVVLMAYAATGLSMVQQDEIAVVRRLGAVTAEPYGPGLHLGLPWGFERIDRLKIDQARTLTFGARELQAPPLSTAPDPASDAMLTGDLNLVSAQGIVQFRLKDRTAAPVAYLFASHSGDATLQALAESGLTHAMAGRSIDDILTTGRAAVAEQIRGDLQKSADALGLGVSIVAVRLGRVAPPDPVAPAFADAARARSDQRQVVTRAEEYQDRARADTKGRAREIADRAAGRHDELVQVAKGEADRFGKLLAEIRKDPASARKRMYLEALAELLPRFTRKVIVPPGQTVDLTMFGEEPTRPEPAGASAP